MELVISCILLAGTLVIGVACNVLASEIYDRVPSLATLLIEKAVARLPKRTRRRYREEWRSHLEECNGNLSRLVHAIGCYLSIERLRREVRSHSSDQISNLQPDVDISKYLDILTPGQKYCLLLKQTGKTNREIASISGWSRSAVKHAQKNGRRRIRKALNRAQDPRSA